MRIRKAELQDSAEILAWRNDEITRQISFDIEIINREKHNLWFKKSLELNTRYLYIGVIGTQKIGICRFDIDIEQQVSEVSINLNPAFRGRKLADDLLMAGINCFRQDHRLAVVAKVKQKNTPSIKLFERCGFHVIFSDENTLVYRYE